MNIGPMMRSPDPPARLLRARRLGDPGLNFLLRQRCKKIVRLMCVNVRSAFAAREIIPLWLKGFENRLENYHA